MALLNGDVELLADYAFLIGEYMGLSDYRFDVQVGGIEDDEHAAEQETHPGSLLVYVRFHDDWADGPPERLREIVVHELTHVIVNPIRTHIRDLETTLGLMFSDPLTSAMAITEEYAVDKIAKNWAPCLPLPVVKIVRAAARERDRLAERRWDWARGT